MKMHSKIIWACVLLLAGATMAQAAVKLPGHLVSPQWLNQHRNEVNIVAVRSNAATFTKAPTFASSNGNKTLTGFGGHIPGALLLDFGKARVPRMVDGRQIKWLLPDQAEFQKLMREVGVKAGRPTVIVPEGLGGADLDMAARVYWSMKVYGDKHLAILNGGTSGWINAGLPVSTAAATAGGGTWTASKADMRYVASSHDVARAIGKAQIVDARPMPFYVGLVKKPNVGAAGHIKGAVNLPPDVRSTESGGSAHYLTAAEYSKIFPHLGIHSKKPSITYCNTGHLASGAWFVLSEVMGNPNVKLYDGSMYEWTTEKRPVVGLR